MKHGGGKVFDNPRTKAAMLELRRQGYSYQSIGRKYGVDHTTIMYHCQAAGLALTKGQKEMMDLLVLEGFTSDEVGEQMGVDGVIIEYYCTHYGVLGSDKYPTRAFIKGKEVDLTEEERERADKNKYVERMFKTDKDGVKWRSDGNGGWLCMGRSEYFQEVGEAKKKKILLEKVREQLLNY